MNDCLRHRGPDDEGFVFFDSDSDQYSIYGGNDTPRSVYNSGNRYTPRSKLNGHQEIKAGVVLGHRRLSIIDLTDTGHQPMCTKDGRYWIVYNGEVYNYLELRDQLTNLGYEFNSQSDTEVILYSFAEWGPEAVKRYIGMFSFALVDRKTNKLFLARDFFGIKPLYYTYWSGGFALASEIKALLTLPHINKDINPQCLFDYLYGGITDHGSGTLLSDIHQLPPAHFLFLDIEKPSCSDPVRYWDINRVANSDMSFSEASEKLRDMFLNSVNLHLRSDVAVGAALSGGIDSSAIVMSMRKLQGSSLDLHTFSHIAEGPDICEEKWVDIIGENASTKVHKVKPIAEELLNDLNSLIYYQDEPFGSTSIYAQYRVMSLAKDNEIKVMLDGQGADEQLAGYNGYVGARLASLIRGCKWASVFRLFRNSTRIGFVQPKTLLMNTGRHFLPASFQANIKKSLGVDKVTHWLSIKWFEDRKVTYPGYKIENKKTVMRYRLYESMTRGPLNCLLRYEDRNSMAFSIESRVPFLTPDLTDFIFSLPEEYILNREGTSKSVFRHAMSGIVPDSILNRKDKIGFATSEFKWLRVLKPWIEGTLNSDVAQSIPILKIDKFKIDWNNILSAKATFDWRVWRVINLIKWCEINKVNFN